MNTIQGLGLETEVQLSFRVPSAHARRGVFKIKYTEEMDWQVVHEVEWLGGQVGGRVKVCRFHACHAYHAYNMYTVLTILWIPCLGTRTYRWTLVTPSKAEAGIPIVLVGGGSHT
jgi:hypothetical protein